MLESQGSLGVVIRVAQGEFVDNDINGHGVYKWVGAKPVHGNIIYTWGENNRIYCI